MNGIHHYTRRVWSAAFALSLSLSLSLPALAGQTGELQGYIIDTDGVPVAGVTVTLSSPQMIGGSKRAMSAEEGDFRFPNLEPGTYAISLDHPTYIPTTERGILVTIDAVVIRDYLLEPRPVTDLPEDDGEGPEEIVVTATAPVVDPTSTTTSTSMRPELTDRLPTSRDYQGMALFAPGAVNSSGADGNPSIRGGTGYGNQYLLDGINITDPVTNTFSTNFNFDSIAETQIITGGMDAEYGYASGGIVNIVTKSGGDEFKLDGSVYWRPSVLRFKEPGEQDDSNAIEANLAAGGPIMKKRLWFFLSGQYVDSSTTIPQDEEFFPGVLTPPTTFRALYLLGKLKWQPTDWQRVTLIMQGDPTWITYERQRDSIGVHPDAERQRFQGGAKLGVSSETTLSSNLLWKTQLGYAADRLQIFPMSGDFGAPSHFNLETGGYTQNDSLDYDNYRFRLQLHSSLTWFVEDFLGDHEVKGGVDGQITWETLYQSTSGTDACGIAPSAAGCYGVAFTDNGLARDGSTLSGVGDPFEVDIVTAPEDKLIWGNTVSVFLQDVWRPFRTLTVRPGLRFDSARAFNDPKDGGRQIFNLNWLSPRIGVAWDPFGDGKTVLRGGYYQYADTGMLLLSEFVGRSIEKQTWEYNPATGRYDIFKGEQGGDDSVTAKDDIVTPVTHELMVGLEREIFANSALGAHVVYRRKNNMWEDDETNVQWNADGSDAVGFNNGKREYIFSLGTPDTAFLQYLGLEMKFDKRLSDHWAMLATYTLSRTEATLEDLITYSHDNPRQAPYEYGFQGDDVTHNLRVSGTYELPLGFIVGGTASYQSGRPYSRYYLNDFYGDYLDRRAPRGCDPDEPWTSVADCKQLRLPDTFVVNARVMWTLKELTGQDIWLMADVFNLLNTRPTVAVETRNVNDGADFGRSLQRARGMSGQLALRYRF